MKFFFRLQLCIFFSMAIWFAGCATLRPKPHPILPQWMKGKFTDDYGISYTINDSVFLLETSAKYHILKWNSDEQYLLTKNDEANKTDKGLYTRIDYMPFTKMEPYYWGFCLTVYNAKDTAAALTAPSADRSIPRKGCNGYPFSRMKRSE